MIRPQLNGSTEISRSYHAWPFVKSPPGLSPGVEREVQDSPPLFETNVLEARPSIEPSTYITFGSVAHTANSTLTRFVGKPGFEIPIVVQSPLSPLGDLKTELLLDA